MIYLSLGDLLLTICLIANSESLTKSLGGDRPDWHLVISMTKSLGFVRVCVSRVSSIKRLRLRNLSSSWGLISSLRSCGSLSGDESSSKDSADSGTGDGVRWSSVWYS